LTELPTALQILSYRLSLKMMAPAMSRAAP